jgi:crossover junction endodeoxyribonuclease RusA
LQRGGIGPVFAAPPSYRCVVLPVEFRVTGIPISHQSHNKQLLESWRTSVAEAALEAIPPGLQPVAVDVELQVVYYFEGAPAQIPDEDNALKPIQDALIGIIYVDDRQVMDGSCSKRDIDGPYRVRRWSPVLAAGFVQGDEFVHVVVRQAPNPEVLKR